MLLFIRKSVRLGVKITHSDNPDILGITLKWEIFGFSHDRTVWFTYAPPLNSPYVADKEGVLNSLETYLTTDDNLDRSLILGDLNDRTAKAADYLNDAGDKYSPITVIEDYMQDIPLPRNNEDKHQVDKQGKLVLNIYKTFKFRILNGRTSGDRWGRVTRFPINREERPSTIDYPICSTTMMNNIRSFFVFPFSDLLYIRPLLDLS